MRFTYDGSTAYIRLQPMGNGRVAHSRLVEDWCLGDVLGFINYDLSDDLLDSVDDEAPVGDVVLDVDKDRRLVGIEIVGADSTLPAAVLELAAHPWSASSYSSSLDTRDELP